MAARTDPEQRDGIVDGLRVDVVRFHETWMELLFPRQRGATHSVLGKWRPTTTADRIKYRAWGAVGALVVALTYPLVLVGFAVRFHARRADSTATRIGLLGVLLVAVVVWGALTALARARFGAEGFLAVAAASLVAVVSAGLAYTFARVDGRPVTVLLAYPFGMTAVFLPPVVAAFYSPTLAGIVFPRSTDLAAWFLDNVAPARLASLLRSQYELEGVAYVLMWFGIAVPLGWILGTLVTLADVVRPKGEDTPPGQRSGEGGPGGGGSGGESGSQET